MPISHLLIFPKHFSTLLYSLGALAFGQLAFRVQDTRVPLLGRTPEADVNRTAQVHGGLASNPDNSESQVQVETLDQARAAGFPPWGGHGWLPEKPVSQATAEGTRVYRKASETSHHPHI